MDQFGFMVGLEKKEAFEGWFSKVDAKECGLMFSVIWGYTTHEESGHAFIQFTSSLSHETAYISYDLSELWVEEEPFVLHIGKNRLSREGMVLDFHIHGQRIEGQFFFSKLSPIETSFLKPGIMGWLTHFPNECNHGLISMNHGVQGALRIGDRLFPMKEAKGYMEKDWGSSFPKAYVWAQSNDFLEGSVVFSYATVPMLGRHAKGFFLLLQHLGTEYRFSSIEGSRLLHFKVKDKAFVAILKKGPYKVVIKAKQAHPVVLASPDHGEMKAKIKESLDGRLLVKVFLKEQELLFLETDRTSIDVHYPLEES